MRKRAYRAPRLTRLGKLTDMTTQAYRLPTIVVH
jgi:hypothetical protein